MRISYIVALLVVLLMVGCAAKQPAAPVTPPAAPETPPAPPPAAETPTTETPAAAPSAGEIVVTNAGFDPAESTAKVGDTVTIKAVEGKHKLTIGGASTPTIEEGSSYDVTLSKAGKTPIFDIITKKSAIITVTE